MSCEAFEEKILDRIDGRLAPEERPALERHLASCADCRAYAELHERLDAALAIAVRPPVLSPHFVRRCAAWPWSLSTPHAIECWPGSTSPAAPAWR